MSDLAKLLEERVKIWEESFKELKNLVEGKGDFCPLIDLANMSVFDEFYELFGELKVLAEATNDEKLKKLKEKLLEYLPELTEIKEKIIRKCIQR